MWFHCRRWWFFRKHGREPDFFFSSSAYFFILLRMNLVVSVNTLVFFRFGRYAFQPTVFLAAVCRAVVAFSIHSCFVVWRTMHAAKERRRRFLGTLTGQYQPPL